MAPHVRVKVLFLFTLTVLVTVTLITSRFKTDISAFFIAGDNAAEILLASEIQSGTLSRRTILSIGSTENKTVSNTFITAFIKTLSTIPGVSAVWKAGETRNAINALEALYLPYGAQLYSRTPAAVLPELLSQQGLANRAAGLKQALLSPQSAIVKRIAAQDPLLLIGNGFKNQFDALQSTQKNAPRYQNLILESRSSGMDVQEQTRIQQEIQRLFTAQVKQSPNTPSTIQLEMTGVPVFAAATQTMIEADVKFVSTVSSLVLGGLFFWIFRRLSVFFWVSCLLVAVVAGGVLVTNLLFGSIHGMALAIGGTLVGICVDYPIHALVHAQATPTSTRAKTIASLWPSMLLGGITTLIGYCALGFSGYPGFQQVAVFAGTGITIALLLTRFALPSLIHELPTVPQRHAFSETWMIFCTRFRVALVAVVVVLSGISIYALNSLQWLEDLQQLTPELDYLKIKDADIRSRMLSIEPGRFVLVNAPDVESALQQAEQVYLTLDQVKAQGKLDDYFGLYPWLLSQQQQVQNARLLNQALTPERKQAWQAALKTEGLSVAHLGNLYYANQTPLTLEQVLTSPIGHLLDNQLVITPEQTLIIIWLTEHEPKALQAAFKNNPHVQYFSQRDLLNTLSTSYLHRAQGLLVLGLALIMLVLSVRYRSLLKALQTLTPALLSMLMLLGLLALNEVPISFLHLIGFLLVISICADYGIFFQENPGRNSALTYQSIATSMLTSAGAFGCLMLAQTTTLKTLAGCVMYGLVAGFLLCPIVIKRSQD